MGKWGGSGRGISGGFAKKIKGSPRVKLSLLRFQVKRKKGGRGNTKGIGRNESEKRGGPSRGRGEGKG